MTARIRQGAVQTVLDAKRNIEACAAARENGKAPLLTDIRGAAPLDAETRHYYSGRQLTDYFTALGILVPIGPFGKMFGNIYLRVANPGIPSKLFSSEDDAIQWLEEFLK